MSSLFERPGLIDEPDRAAALSHLVLASDAHCARLANECAAAHVQLAQRAARWHYLRLAQRGAANGMAPLETLTEHLRELSAEVASALENERRVDEWLNAWTTDLGPAYAAALQCDQEAQGRIRSAERTLHELRQLDATPEQGNGIQSWNRLVEAGLTPEQIAVVLETTKAQAPAPE